MIIIFKKLKSLLIHLEVIKMKLRIIDKPKVKIQFQFELKDWWIGLYWQHTKNNMLHIYICFIPLLPLHITILKDPLSDEDSKHHWPEYKNNQFADEIRKCITCNIDFFGYYSRRRCYKCAMKNVIDPNDGKRL